MSGFPAKHLVAAPIVFLLFFYGLTTAGLLSADEPRYAAIGLEMASSGDWITPRLWGEPWFEKPPLLYWMIALGFKAGLSEDLAPRLPIALLSAGFILLFFYRIRREFGERAALYASAILATSAGWLAYSHVAVTDIPLATTFSAALLLCLPWVRSGGRRGLFVAGILLGLAMLAKGLVPLVLIAPLLWIAGRRWPNLLILAGAALAVAAPWFVLCYLRNGDAFVDEFIWKHHFGRFFSPELQHVQPWWFYIPVLIGLLFPWCPMLAIAPHYTQDNRRKLLLAVAGFGFVFFSAAANKLPGYLLPLLPAAGRCNRCPPDGDNSLDGPHRIVGRAVGADAARGRRSSAGSCEWAVHSREYCGVELVGDGSPRAARGCGDLVRCARTAHLRDRYSHRLDNPGCRLYEVDNVSGTGPRRLSASDLADDSTATGAVLRGRSESIAALWPRILQPETAGAMRA